MNLLTKPVLYAVTAALLASLVWGGWQWRQAHSERTAHAETRAGHAEVLRKLADLTAKAATAVRNRENEVRDLLDSSNTAREEGIANAVKAQQEYVHGVRTGAIRLRGIWAGCPAPAAVPGDAGAIASADADAALRAEGAGAAVRIGDDADVQVAGLQAYARACHALTQPITTGD